MALSLPRCPGPWPRKVSAVETDGNPSNITSVSAMEKSSIVHAIGTTDFHQLALCPGPDQEQFCTRCWDLIKYASRTAIYGYYHSRSKFKGEKHGNCRLCQFLGTLGLTGGTTIYTQNLGNVEDIERQDDVGRHNTSGTLFRLGLVDGRSFAVLHPRSPDCSIAAQRIAASSIDYDTVKDWIGRCKIHHFDRCGRTVNTVIPGLKVIDCQTKKIVRPSSNCHYVALSYVWGSQASQFPNNNAWPRTITDSVILTLRLGFRYLWVDRYCIDQANAAEKHDQIQNMHDIYNNAELTIVAAAGENPDYGLPGVGSRSRQKQRCFKFNDLELVEVYVFDNMVQRTAWNSRAWTLQESIISRRRLVFTDHEMIFECSLMHQRESIRLKDRDYGHLRNSGLQWRSLPNQDLRGWWDHPYILAKRAIGHCSDRQLSFEADALNACLGILKYYRVHHLGGVLVRPPNDDIEKYTMYIDWTKGKPGRRREGFPSWSWASVSSSVCDDYMESYRGLAQECMIEIPLSGKTWLSLENWCHDGGLAETSKPKNYLRITGSVVPIRLLHENQLRAVAPHRRGAPLVPRQGTPHATYYFEINGTPTRSLRSFRLDDENDDAKTLLDAVALITFTKFHTYTGSAAYVMFLKPVVGGYKRVGMGFWRVDAGTLPVPKSSRISFLLY